MATQIKTIKQLKELCLESNKEAGEDAIQPIDCFLRIGTSMRSSKAISYDPSDKSWEVLHEIDGSTDRFLRDKDLLEGTNIGKAMETGNLFMY